jgi:uncharacterized membrane protein
MPAQHSQTGDQRIDRTVAQLLLVGVAVAASVVLLGGIVFLAQQGAEAFDFATFRGEPDHLRTVPGILKGALSLSGQGVIQLGILLLIATPVARVLFSAFAFARKRDKVYVIITLVVLVNLLLGLTGVI